VGLLAAWAVIATAAGGAEFKVGYAQREITPTKPVPMWGYGADATVSWVALGTGEQMMDKALINIYTMMGKFKSKIPRL
jgi:hypothetical protein